MRILVVILVLALIALHQDYWNWDTYQPLVGGIVPSGLAWHIGISIASAVIWWLAVTFCWPAHVDELDPALNAKKASSKIASKEDRP